MDKRVTWAAVVLAAAGVAGVSSAGAVAGTPSDGTATGEFVGKADVGAASIGYTHYWGNRAGWWKLRLTGMPVSAGQAVAVSVSECSGVGVEWMGDARFSVYNVVVENGVVTTRVFVDSGSALGLCAHYVVA